MAINENGTVCNNDGLCKLCNRPIFPSDQPIETKPNYNDNWQPFHNPLDDTDNPNHLPIQPTQYPLPQPIQPTQPIQLKPRPNPINPFQPQRPIPNPPPTNQQPINPPPSNPPSGTQPVMPGLPSGGDNQAIQWLLFGTGDIAGGLGTADMIALLGADVPLYAWSGPVALVIFAISAAVVSLLSIFGVGRPKLQATSDISLYANSPSPILSTLGQAALRARELGIPLSTSDPTVWSTVFGPAITDVYNQLQSLYPTYNARQIQALMYILIQEMGDPAHHSPIFIIQLLRDQLKSGIIKPPSPQTVSSRVIGKLRIVKRGQKTYR